MLRLWLVLASVTSRMYVGATHASVGGGPHIALRPSAW